MYNDNNDDKPTVILVLSGNIEAYGDIVHRYKDKIFNIIYAIIKNYHTAEDLTQDTFIDGYVKLKSLEDPCKIGAWLVRIAKNKCYNYLARSEMQYESELYDYIPDTITSAPDNLVIEQQERQTLKQAVQQLPELQRTVTELYYFENCSQKKIAELLKIPIGTVSRRLYDARIKLKKELENMDETIKSIDFEAEVAKRINSLERYYYLHNGSNEGKQKAVDELIKFIDTIPQSKLKHMAYHNAYIYSDKEEHKSQIEKEAELADLKESADYYFNIFFEKYWTNHLDEKFFEAIDGEEGIKKLEKMADSNNAVGELYNWRGACNLTSGNIKEARKDYQKAAERINQDSVKYATAISGLKSINALESDANKYLKATTAVNGFGCVSYDKGKKLDFYWIDGFSDEYYTYKVNAFSNFYYYCAGMKKSSKFFDLNMSEGETIGEDTLVSKNETVAVSAGTFENCIHVKSVSSYEWWNSDRVVDTWYAKDVGIVKCEVKKEGGNDSEIYELCEYKINGGDGYMPAELGNLWKYKNITLPDFYQQILEYEVTSVSKDTETNTKFIYMSFLEVLRPAKDNCDSETHLMVAKSALPHRELQKWDFDAAIENLKLAVQKNTSVKTNLFAANAVNYVERFREYHAKGWHLLPSSLYGMPIYINKSEGKIISGYSGSLYSICLSPDLSSWYDVRQCMGIRPFRFLTDLAGALFSEKWIVGYSEKIKHNDSDVYLKVEDAGTVTVKAGTFGNCLKVTLELEKMDETDEKYYVNNNAHCGTKIYYYAPNVGIVKHDCRWGNTLLPSSCELTEYVSYATNGEYMPIYIGNQWVYHETTLEPEFNARKRYRIISGMEDEFFMIEEQEMLFRGTAEEYEEFIKMYIQ